MRVPWETVFRSRSDWRVQVRCVLVAGLIFATDSDAQTASAPTSSSQERIDNRDVCTSGKRKPDTKREEEEEEAGR